MTAIKRQTDSTSTAARTRGRRGRLITAVAIAVAALAIVGCGSALSTDGGGVAAGAIQAPSLLKAQRQVTTAERRLHRRARARARARAPRGVRVNLRAVAGAQPLIIRGNPVHRPAPGTGGATLNDDYQGHSADDDGGPCALISRARAAALLHRAVDAPILALQGPSCIYRESGTRTQVTVTVELASFGALTHLLHNRRQAEVAGHGAVCAGSGAQVTYVQLSAKRVLSVTGACSVGERFAAAALGG